MLLALQKSELLAKSRVSEVDAKKPLLLGSEGKLSQVPGRKLPWREGVEMREKMARVS